MTDTLQKALSILTAQAANPIALEALVSSMERHTEGLQAHLEGKQYDGSGVVTQGHTEAPVQPKHPLEDYQITEKDVGSLCVFTRSGVGEINILHTFDNGDTDYPFRTKGGYWRRSAEPYLDPIKLHFIPYYATPDSVAPDDLGEHFAVLWNDGDVILKGGLNPSEWRYYGDVGEPYIIGYRPLNFVNPLKQDK